MKIESLELVNFRNHNESFMAFGDLNYIVGANNAGKSSIKGAFQYALTGDNEWAPKGRGAKVLIKEGCAVAEVEVGIERLGLIRRAIKDSGTSIELNSNKLPARELEKELLEDFKVSNEVISCVIDSSKFLNLSPLEQKNFLFRLTNATLDAERIISFMEEPSKEAKAKIRKMVKKKITIEELDKIYKEFFDERRLAKKEKGNLEARLKTIEEAPESKVDLDDAKLEEKQKKIGKDRDEALKAIATMDERVKQQTRLEDLLKDLQEKIKSIKSKTSEDISIAEAEELAFEYVTTINNIESTLNDYRVDYNTLRGENKSLESMLPKLTELTKCPLSDRLICKTDKTPLIKEIEEQIKTNKNEMKKIEDKGVALKNELKKKKEKKDQIEKHVKLASNLVFLEEQLTRAQKDYSKLEVPKDKDSLLNSLRERIVIADKETREIADKRKAYEESVKLETERKKLSKRITESDNLIELYEYLVLELSPKGVKQRVLEAIIDPIEAHCNKVLHDLTKGTYKLSFNFDGEFDILVTNESGEVSYKCLSDSEKLRIGVVLQDAINNLTNVKILVIDNADILDGDNFNLLQKLLNKIRSTYDNIFVFASMDDDDILELKGKGIEAKIFKVDKGIVSEI